MTEAKKLNPLLIIITIALLLRIPLLNGSFWLDEAAQALESIRPLSQQFDIIADFQPPLLHIILHFASYFSHSESWLRTIGALVPGLVTIVFSYKLAKKLFSSKVAIVSSLLLATSSFHVFYSQELRPYSLPTMFATMSSYYFIKLINKTPVGLNNKKVKNIFFHPLAFLNLLGLYSSYLFPFFIISQLTFTLVKDFGTKKKLTTTTNFLKTQLFTIILFIPWLPSFFKQLTAGQMVRKLLPGWETVVSIPQLKAIPLVVGKFTFGVLNISNTPFFIIGTILTLIPLLILWYLKLKEVLKTTKIKKWLNKIFNNKDAEHFTLLTFTFLVPLLTSWLISFFVPVVRPKRLLFLLPTFYILVAYLSINFSKEKTLDKIKSASSFNKQKYFFTKTKITSFLAKLMLTSFFVVNLVSLSSYYFNPQLQRENWRELYSEITKQFSPYNTAIIYSFPGKFAPITWYEKETVFPSIATKTLHIDQVDDLNSLLKPATQFENVLIFDYLRDLTDPEKKIEKTLKTYDFHEVGTLEKPNIGFVRVLTRPHNLIGIRVE